MRENERGRERGKKLRRRGEEDKANGKRGQLNESCSFYLLCCVDTCMCVCVSVNVFVCVCVSWAFYREAAADGWPN